MIMSDRTLVCSDCGRNFLFSISEQEFYAEKGFLHDPKRCADCRATKKLGDGRVQGELFAAICAQCGIATQVPFKPSGVRPVLCRECFKLSR
jgi:CxxC-x17-CxxC domain-containing protein